MGESQNQPSQIGSSPAVAAHPTAPSRVLLRVLMKPWLDRTIAAIALLPFCYSMYYRYRHFGLTLPVTSYFIATTVLILTMVFRRPPKRITPNPLFWLLTFLNTYWAIATLSFMDRGRAVVPNGVADAMAIVALVVILWARFSLGRNIGFVPAQRELVNSGAYRYVRHPIYSGVMLTWLSVALRSYSPRNITLLGLAFFWTVLKSFVEESFLRADPQYAAYMTKVRARWIPFLV